MGKVKPENLISQGCSASVAKAASEHYNEGRTETTSHPIRVAKEEISKNRFRQE